MLVYDHLVPGNKELEDAYGEFMQSRVPPLLVTMVALHSNIMCALEIKPNWSSWGGAVA